MCIIRKINCFLSITTGIAALISGASVCVFAADNQQAAASTTVSKNTAPSPLRRGEVTKTIPAPGGGHFVIARFPSKDGFRTTVIAKVDTSGKIVKRFKTDDRYEIITSSLAVLPDGNLVVFGHDLRQPRYDTSGSLLLRLKINSSPEPIFEVFYDSNDYFYVLGVQPNGRVLVGFAGGNIIRLNTNGSVDSSFSPKIQDGLGELKGIEAQANGQVLVYGSSRTARLNANGSFVGHSTDSWKEPTGPQYINEPGEISVTAASGDKQIVGGYFNYLNGKPCDGVARLNKDGTLDPSFNSGSTFSAPVTQLLVQANGGLLVNRAWTVDPQDYEEFPGNRITRLKPDGSEDDTFSVIGYRWIELVKLEPDGKFLLWRRDHPTNGTFLDRYNANGKWNSTIQKK